MGYLMWQPKGFTMDATLDLGHTSQSVWHNIGHHFSIVKEVGQP